MKLIFSLYLLSFSFTGLSTVKYYQDNRLVGIEKRNESNQIICKYGLLIDVHNPQKKLHEYEQFFYDSLGRLEYKIKGELLRGLEIHSYVYDDTVLIQINDHISTNLLWRFPTSNYFVLFFDSNTNFSNTHPLIKDSLLFTIDEIQKELKSRTSVKKWERINYSEYRKDIFYSYTLHEGVEHHSWEENRYDFETGKIQVIRHSDCMGRRTGIFYPSEQAYLEIEYDSLNRKKKGFVYTLDNEYTRDRERYYSYDNANNLILIEEVLRGFDLEEYDTNHRFLERFVHYKYDGVNRLVGKRSVNYNDSVLNELEIEYNSKGDIIAKEQSNSTNFKRRIKYNFAGYPKWISTNYKSIDIHGNSIAKSFIWKLKYNKSHQLIGLKESLNYSSEPEIRHNYSIVYN